MDGACPAPGSVMAAKLVRQRSSLIGKTVTITGPASDEADLLFQGREIAVDAGTAALNDEQLGWLDKMKAAGAGRTAASTRGFLTNSDSRAGAGRGLGAIVGSALMLLVTAVCASRSACGGGLSRGVRAARTG